MIISYMLSWGNCVTESDQLYASVCFMMLSSAMRSWDSLAFGACLNWLTEELKVWLHFSVLGGTACYKRQLFWKCEYLRQWRAYSTLWSTSVSQTVQCHHTCVTYSLQEKNWFTNSEISPLNIFTVVQCTQMQERECTICTWSMMHTCGGTLQWIHTPAPRQTQIDTCTDGQAHTRLQQDAKQTHTGVWCPSFHL